MEHITKVKDLYERTVTMISESEENWREFLECMGRLYQLDYLNTCMVYAQRPDATVLAGFDEWMELKCVDDVVDTGTLKIGKSDYNYNTLEPKLLKVNGLDKLNQIFGTDYTNEDDLRKFMKHNKTECALRIFESSEQIEIPEYILEAIRW